MGKSRLRTSIQLIDAADNIFLEVKIQYSTVQYSTKTECKINIRWITILLNLVLRNNHLLDNTKY